MSAWRTALRTVAVGVAPTAGFCLWWAYDRRWALADRLVDLVRIH